MSYEPDAAKFMHTFKDRYGRVWQWQWENQYQHCGVTLPLHIIRVLSLAPRDGAQDPDRDFCEICRTGRPVDTDRVLSQSGMDDVRGAVYRIKHVLDDVLQELERNTAPSDPDPKRCKVTGYRGRCLLESGHLFHEHRFSGIGCIQNSPYGGCTMAYGHSGLHTFPEAEPER